MAENQPSEIDRSIDLATTVSGSANQEITATQHFEIASLIAEEFGNFSESQTPSSGKYTLKRKLGEGGFGSVWVADQHFPVQREVAVKVLKSGMLSQEILARFSLERQVLAVMDHPGIAKVYDAGVTTTGMPFFVMELVRGVPLTQFCESESLSVQKRLGLFIQACQALHHAHRKGIIHRDLKPSNVLVTVTDHGPQVKVIDFGIAKATASITMDQSMQTQVGQFMGTPAYMSPEQADGLIDEIDVRSDVYSLGVVLYELLTGVRPFEFGGSHKLSLEDVRRCIRMEIPVRPSSRIISVISAKGNSNSRIQNSEARLLATSLKGDLDWITLKALEKHPSRRYDSAQDLAADVERHLRREPVLAFPPSRWYVASRFISRHRLAVATTAIVILTLTVASVLSTWLLINEQIARRSADLETNRAKQVVKILKDMISAAGPSVSQGRDAALMRDILDATATRIETDLKDQPEIELDIRRLLARAYHDIGEFEKAHQLMQRVLELEELLHANDKTRIANTYAEVSESLDMLDRLEHAETMLRKAIQIREGISPLPTNDIARDRELLAWLLSRRGHFADSELEARRAISEFSDPGDEGKLFRGGALMTLGLTLLKTAQFAESEQVHREALAIHRSLHDKPHPDIVTAINNLCHLLIEVGKYDEVETLAREGLKMQEELDGKPIGTCTDSLNKALSSVYVARKEYAKAIESLELAIQAATEVYGPDHRFTNDKRSLLAQVYLESGNIAKAEETLEQAKKLGGTGESADNSLEIARGKLAFHKGDLETAKQIALEEYSKKKGEANTPSTGQIEATLLLIDVHLAKNEKDAARSLILEAMQVLRPDKNESSILLQSVMERFAILKSAGG